MREAGFNLQLFVLLLLCCTHDSNCSSYTSIASLYSLDLDHDTLLSSPDKLPSVDQTFLPLIAPSPLIPFTNNGVPKLSGLCTFDFSANELLLNTTVTDCWGPFAPYLSNAICCPQLKATLTILTGGSSKYSGDLVLNSTVAKHCLADTDQILQSQGAIENLHEMCKISILNLTHGSCPLIKTNEIDQILDYSKLVAKCGKIDIVSECCTRVCQKEISNAASIIINTRSSRVHLKTRSLVMKKDCESVVLRWIATKLDQVSMSALLRGISSCDINKECPLVLPNTTNISENCRNTGNKEDCCSAMENYLSQLQEQTLITNLQALNCAELLGITLQKANVTRDVYNICQIKLEDFTLQALDVIAGAPASSQGPGCLLPSLPLDATYDKTYGISFICDLNDNVAANWPSNSSSSASSCDNSTMLPALPKATSSGTGLRHTVTRIMSPPLVILILLLFVELSIESVTGL